ncbi:MAG: Na/Pi cotransporter family protein [Lachnospiraceae bacterium]|nr:Na/Pi cotransporter family protein [Lachnospiraceae bacterium]
MNIFDVLSMVGGLALFLYGMHAMGEGLSKLSGGKLERILEKLTASPIKGVLLGAAVTAVIQSSSATTVMVVGFVNSGIMRLSQAINIIMGANVGTTITSWVLSLSGMEGDSLWIQLLKPSSFSPVLALIGVSFLLFSKNAKKQDIGTILVGFSVLMTGMDTMSAAVKPLADIPEFTNILTMFSNPILGLLAGAVLTAVIQSSSASVGILQALCVTGAIHYDTALPIIMGQNIGTCITALLSGIGATKNAKRASVVHLYFNLIGTAIFMISFYLLNTFVNFSFLDQAAGAAGIAFIHSVFNIVATLILLPFSKGLEKLAYLTIRDGEELPVNIEEFQLLDERFLDKPAFAVQQCKAVAAKMAELSKEAIILALDMLQSYRTEKFEQVCKMEEYVDRYEDELGTYLVRLSSRNLTEKDSRTISMLLHCIGDFERISDHAINISEAAKEMNDKNMTFSEDAIKEISVFAEAIREIVETAVTVFIKDDVTMARLVEPLEEVVDNLNIEMKSRHITRLREGKCTIEMGFILSDLTTNYERVADHCSNIAVCLIQIHANGFDMHEYLDTLDKGENTIFREEYLSYKAKYMLP